MDKSYIFIMKNRTYKNAESFYFQNRELAKDQENLFYLEFRKAVRLSEHSSVKKLRKTLGEFNRGISETLNSIGALPQTIMKNFSGDFLKLVEAELKKTNQYELRKKEDFSFIANILLKEFEKTFNTMIDELAKNKRFGGRIH